ncbi:MAG: tRNA (adenosine(37)-N6)-threonylcarbamoyltransferase complex ATPase subunit type 1 TsaE [Christensenellales bacterium]
MSTEIVVESLNETENLAKNLSKKIENGMVILLYGEIGAGKTTFTKFLLQHLGVKSVVSSPTFTLLNEYSGDFPIYHFDMYRIQNVEEIYELGFEDYINSKNSPFTKTGLTLIEWPENVKDVLPKDAVKIEIKKLGNNKRKFIIDNLQ